MTDTAALPATFAVPRDGELVRVSVETLDDLRLLRTELELLDRIEARLRLAASRGTRHGPGPCDDESRDELGRILEDARCDEVRLAIARIDRDYEDIRKDIVMTVVNDEADRIVQDALAGEADGDVTPAPLDAALPEGVDAALATAEAELAQLKATEEPKQGARVDPPPADPDTAATPDPIEEAVAGIEHPDTIPADIDAEFDAAPTPASIPDSAMAPQAEEPPPPFDTRPAVDQPGIADPTRSDNDCAADTGFEEPRREPSGSAKSDTRNAAAEDHVNQATAAVNEIESGIRAVADILGSEVNRQWAQARLALAEISEARTKAHEVLALAQTVLTDINRVKAQAEVACAEADAARKEAKLIREDAGRAKERAETAAHAAELAADQAAREARSAAPVPA